MLSDIAKERQFVINNMMNKIKKLTNSDVTLTTLEIVKEELINLAKMKEIFPMDEFPPIKGGNSSMYILYEDVDHKNVLYMVAPEPGGYAPPHDHQTWAVIAGMYGIENNKIYKRIDNGKIPNYAELELLYEVDIKDGNAIALMPEDIHAIKLGDTGFQGNLHLYGLSVEHCHNRKLYSRSKKSYKTYPAATGVLPANGAIIGGVKHENL